MGARFYLEVSERASGKIVSPPSATLCSVRLHASAADRPMKYSRRKGKEKFLSALDERIRSARRSRFYLSLCLFISISVDIRYL